MSEEIKKPMIDAGVVAKVIWQAQKALQEQLGVQGIAEWNNASDEDRDHSLNGVLEYLKDNSKFKEAAQKDKGVALTCAIIDTLISSEEEEKPVKKASKKG